ncbi:MAG: ABC transporter ATP-binding protein [Betaproteobacteria bacterium]|nr:ABC transporter ATP-binding protein [Betaproteobacteria bacterium]
MLEARALNIAYGDAPALWDVSITVGKGELVSVVGSNGAGKTTLVNTIARLLPIRGGSLWLDGVELTHASAIEMCQHGVAIIPEGRKLFTGMTVEENLEMGCYRAGARGFRDQTLARVYGLFPILRERRRQTAGTLSGGQQQMLAIGRALMARPSLLLIDEPSLGLSPLIVEEVFNVIRAVHAEGVSILLIEQNAAMALALVERAYVMESGRIVSEGRPAELLVQPHIREAYLGLDTSSPQQPG